LAFEAEKPSKKERHFKAARDDKKAALFQQKNEKLPEPASDIEPFPPGLAETIPLMATADRPKETQVLKRKWHFWQGRAAHSKVNAVAD